MVPVETVEFGDFIMEPRRLAVIPDALGGADGVLGMDGLADKRIQIDFRRDRITITRSRNKRASSGFTTIPVNLLHGLLVADAVMGGVPVKAVIDTGGQITLGNLALRLALAERRRKGVQEGKLDQVFGSTLDMQVGTRLETPALVLGSLLVRSSAMTFADFEIFKYWHLAEKRAMLIGMDVLGLLRHADHRLPKAGAPGAIGAALAMGVLALPSPVAADPGRAGAADRDADARHVDRHACDGRRRRHEPTSRASSPPTRRDRIGRIWAPVLVNGAGPFRLVLDTGASHSALTARVVEQARHRATTRPSRSCCVARPAPRRCRTLPVETLEFGDLLVEPRRLPIVPDALGGAEGILGMDGLAGKRIRIDFRKDSITIRRSKKERADDRLRDDSGPASCAGACWSWTPSSAAWQ